MARSAHRIVRVPITLVTSVVAVASGCDKPSSATTGGSAVASGSATARPVPAKPPAPPVLAAGAFDQALSARHIPVKNVVQRKDTPTAAWGLIATRDTSKKTTGFDVLRVRASEVATLHFAPPVGRSRFADDVASLDVRDLDDDGNTDATIVVGWTREIQISDRCQGCFRTVDEEATQLHIVSGAAAELRDVFTHLITYTTSGESYPEENGLAPPDPDDVAYDWRIGGTPPTLKMTRTKSKLVTDGRLPGMLPVTTDPLLSAGAGKDIPLVFH
jgi:hypothetical protein